MTKSILAIGAHPDDVEFFMAGTLALFKSLGWHISIGVVAKGDCGSKQHSRREITAIRRAEAVRAAKILGADLHLMEQNDLCIEVNTPTRRIVTEVVRKSRADIVLTHPPSDYMTDHEFTSRLVRDACFCAAAPNYETEAGDPADPIDHIPALFYSDPVEGVDLFGTPARPSFVVDISTHIDLKRELLACHESQREWLRAQHGIDQYLIAMEHWASTCGSYAGVPFGEGYRQHLGHAFPHEPILSETLGDCVKNLVS